MHIPTNHPEFTTILQQDHLTQFRVWLDRSGWIYHGVYDFDGTITTGPETCWDVLGSILGPKYQSSAYDLYRQYAHYEQDPQYTREVRMRWVKKWWEEASKLLAQHGLRKSDISASAVQLLKFRRGIYELLEDATNQWHPITIVSAGISEVIEAILRWGGLLWEQTQIVGNSLSFDQAGEYQDIPPESPIFLGNKDTRQVVESRYPTLVVGDHPSDIQMAREFTGAPLLRVGIISPRATDSLREQMRARYHVIIESDTWDAWFFAWLMSPAERFAFSESFC